MAVLYQECSMGHIKPNSDLLTYELNPSVKVFLYGKNKVMYASNTCNN